MPPIGRLFAVVWLLALCAVPAGRAQIQIRLDPAKQLTQYQLDHWGAEEGLPQSSVTALAKTTDGYFWLGTQEGLVRFDGVRFTVYDNAHDGLPHDYVTSLAADAAGGLWVGTMGGGLLYRQGGRFTSYTSKDGLASNRISSLAFDAEGNLWIGTEEAGLSRYRDGRFTTYTTEDGLPSLAVTSLATGPDGAVWVGLRKGLVRTAAAGAEIEPFTIIEALDGLLVSALAADSAGVWVGTLGAGALHLVGGTVVERLGIDDGLPDDKIVAVERDEHGILWFGLHGGGIARLHDGRLSTLGTQQGLAHGVVKTLFPDREGSLWIGTDGGGLNRLRDGKFLTYTTAEGLSYDHVPVVMEARNGDIWVGTEGGGLNRIREGRITTFTRADGLPHDGIYGLAETSDGTLWIGTYGGGLVRYRNGRFTAYTPAEGFPSKNVYGLFADRKDNVWATTGMGLIRTEGSRFRLFDTSDGLASNLVTVVEEDREGDLWVGTYDAGLNRMRGEQVVGHYGAEQGLRSNTVIALHADDEGVLWVGTSDGGLHALIDGKLAAFTVHHGLPTEKIFQILEDDRGNLWMTSNKGVFSVAKDELLRVARGDAETVAATLYDQHDGLKSHEFYGGTQPAGWRARDGRLWLPTLEGVASIDPSHIPRDLRPPRVLVDEFIAGDRLVPVSASGEVEVGPGPRKFEFHYTAFSYLAPEDIHYRYKLDGVDEAWVEAGTRREAYYTNLEPGSYTFQVMARNSDGVWSTEPATITFYLRPFFYQTAWFKALLVLAALLAIVGGYALRMRQMFARQIELELQVQARTRDLREAKEHIEAQAEQLREMDRIKTRFFNNISHEFRTPLTLNIGPLENALTGLYGPVDGPLRKQLTIMLRNARRLLRLINQLLDLSKLEAGSLALRPQHGDLAGFVEGIVLSFTAFVERKKIALDFESDVQRLPANYDPEALEKVFFNLLSNAVKFTPEGGRITVALSRAGNADGEMIYARVSDTGHGIPAKDLPYIFDRFRQVDGVVSDVQEGTGIGLSLVKELVELHGGTIEVESEPGVGTTFTVGLPCALATAPASGSNDGASAPDASVPVISRGPMMEMAVFEDDDSQTAALAPDADRPTLLVVDDNQDIRDYMVSCLEARYHLRIARDGAEALELIRADEPDLVISDVMMPRMTGYELCAAVKQDPALRHLPVILLTAKASVDDKIEGLEAGADDYLAKPFNARELLARVENLLTLGRHQRELRLLNDELSDVNDALRSASELKSQFLRIAAHDLRNPLNSIQGCASIIREEMEAVGMDVELPEIILSASKRMVDLIKQILEAEALESGELTFEMAPIDLRRMAHAVGQYHRSAAAQKRQKMEVLVPDDASCRTLASEDWLRAAFDNLVSNAIKYSPLGTSVTIEVARVDAMVQFRVRDQGPGISDEDRPRLFKKFQKLSAQPTAGEPSTGLGLSIVKQIVDAHNGRVWVDAAPEGGSIFVVELRALPDGPVPSAHPSTPTDVVLTSTPLS